MEHNYQNSGIIFVRRQNKLSLNSAVRQIYNLLQIPVRKKTIILKFSVIIK